MSARITHEVILYLTSQFLYISRTQSFPIQAGQTVQCPAESHSSSGGTRQDLTRVALPDGGSKAELVNQAWTAFNQFMTAFYQTHSSTQWCHKIYPTGEPQEDLPRPKGVSVHPGWRKRQGLARQWLRTSWFSAIPHPTGSF